MRGLLVVCVLAVCMVNQFTDATFPGFLSALTGAGNLLGGLTGAAGGANVLTGGLNLLTQVYAIHDSLGSMKISRLFYS